MSKTIKEQIEAIDPINALANEVAVKNEQIADAVQASTDIDGKAELSQALTSELIEDRVTAVCMGLNHVFYEPELRQEGTNGYFYALDYNGWADRTDGAEPTGNEVVVDKNSFMGAALLFGLCNAFDYQLRNRMSASEKLRDGIRRDIAFGQLRGIDVTSDVEAKATRLERSVEQESMLKVAFLKACENYHALTGKVFESRDERAATKQRAAQVAKADPRLAKLGV